MRWIAGQLEKPPIGAKFTPGVLASNCAVSFVTGFLSAMASLVIVVSLAGAAEATDSVTMRGFLGCLRRLDRLLDGFVGLGFFCWTSTGGWGCGVGCCATADAAHKTRGHGHPSTVTMYFDMENSPSNTVH